MSSSFLSLKNVLLSSSAEETPAINGAKAKLSGKKNGKTEVEEVEDDDDDDEEEDDEEDDEEEEGMEVGNHVCGTVIKELVP